MLATVVDGSEGRRGELGKEGNWEQKGKTQGHMAWGWEGASEMSRGHRIGGKDGVRLRKGSPGRGEGKSPIRGDRGVSSPASAPKDRGGWEAVPAPRERGKGGEGAGEGGRPTTAGASRAKRKPETGKRRRWGKGWAPEPGRAAGTPGSALRGRGWTTARGQRGDAGAGGDWGRGMPGQRRPGLGARWAAAGAQRGRGGAPTRAAASAASPLPGMSEEPPRRLPSILGSAASPTALGEGHSTHPGSPPSPPGASCCQPGSAARSYADATRARSRLSSDSPSRRLSACSRPPGRAWDHTRAPIGCPAPGRGMCRTL